jgi:regulator of Ty1 transposition protein 103
LLRLISAPSVRKLVFMYLANDVIQNSKKKGPEYSESFSTILAKAFKDISQRCDDEKTFKSLDRILRIWEERGVYDADKIKEFDTNLGKKPKAKSSAKTVAPSAPSDTKKKEETPSRKRKSEEPSTSATNGSDKKKPKVPTPSKAKVVEVNGEKHVTLSPQIPVGDPPEPEELIKMLQDLEEAASSDAVTRERITRLPTGKFCSSSTLMFCN